MSRVTAYYFLIILFSSILFIPFIGNLHLLDWDEINFAEIAREMIVSKNYLQPQINFQPFYEKPPFFAWLQSASMHVFGINEFGARFPNAFLGIVTNLTLFEIGRRHKNIQFGWLWVLFNTASILPHIYFKSGLIDPWFNYFIFLALYFLTIKEKVVLAGLFIGLAMLTKGHAALLIAGVTSFIYWVLVKKRRIILFKQILLFSLIGILVFNIWLLWNYIQYDSTFIREFIVRQWQLLTTADAGHAGFPLYHVVVLFFGCFPASILFIAEAFRKSNNNDNFILLQKIIFWVVLLLFSLVKTKIVHYSSLCYYPITFLAASNLYGILYNNIRIKRYQIVLFVVLSSIYAIVIFVANGLLKNTNWLEQKLLSLKSAEIPVFPPNIEVKIYFIIPALLLMLGIAVMFFKYNLKTKIAVLFVCVILFIQTGLYFNIKNVEKISQNAHIDFWKKNASNDYYYLTYRFKSYAPYFYKRANPQNNTLYLNTEYLLSDSVDKPVLISCRLKDTSNLLNTTKNAQLVGIGNIYAFYLKK